MLPFSFTIRLPAIAQFFCLEIFFIHRRERLRAIPKNVEKLYDLQKIIELRDSIGKIFVPGRNVGSYMLTEKAYEPYFKRMKIKEFNAIETRGTWELKNDFMAGPFLNYMINDTVNNRFLMLDGFVFSPSSRKREMIFEIEAIYKSLKIYKKESK